VRRRMDRITTRSWHITTFRGREIHGVDVGSFTKVKDTIQVKDLFVITAGGRRYAQRGIDEYPLKFDFFVHIVAEGNQVKNKTWKLITFYRDRSVTRVVSWDGSYKDSVKWL
jgi:hypothetical protein